MLHKGIGIWVGMRFDFLSFFYLTTKGYFDQSVDIYKAPAVAQWILESAGREGQVLLEQLNPIHQQCKVKFWQQNF